MGPTPHRPFRFFSYTFGDTVGVYPYFCRPHEGLGMKGTITASSPSGEHAGVGGEQNLRQATWGALKELVGEVCCHRPSG